MSFFGGFGQNNQQKPGGGFGGFGSNTDTTGGFGSNTGTGFGNTTNNNTTGTGTGIFGKTSSGFGSSGFGSNTQQQSSPFGGFGSSNTTSAGGLFGSTTATSGSTGFGGFGSNTTNTSTPFGSSNAGGGLFDGAGKPAFGSTANTTGSLFGGGTAPATGFGSNATTGAFGSPASTALGGGNLQCEGTGSTPFSAYTEKDPGSTQTNHFQTITFQQPYQKFSLEELRLADYTQGRRFGNASGQPGAFGANTGFGGFGSNTGFGNAQSATSNPFGGASSSPFGGAQSTPTAGFGGNTGGGLFGSSSKPGGGLFGSATTTAPAAGGLFGSSGTTAFGGNSNTGFGSGTAGGGLFGNSNQQTQNKPAFGAQPSGTTSGFGGFGATPSSSGGGGLFGSSTTATSAPFGGSTQPQGTSFGGGFGNQQAQTQGGGLFGGFGANNTANNQQKPGGLFGSTTGTATGGGLFGNQNNQQQSSGGLFGSSNTNQAGGGLFGNNQAKPAAPTGGGLFGNNSQPQTGGLFPSAGQQNQQNQGGLFGAGQQQKPGGLFGATTTSNATGGGLFGNSNNNQSQPVGSSLFGNTNNAQSQQQQGGGNAFGGSSLFGGSQNQQQSQQAPALTASILAQNPYGHDSLFQNLSTPNSQSVGPIATPLSSSQKLKKNAILPQYKINPSASARFITPQKRGYGFSYSTYGTPASASSNLSTPGGLSNSLLGGSYGRGLGKSLSTSNLRRTFDGNESILSPGAFSASSPRYSHTGSLKRLTIHRGLRSDLFGSPEAPAQLPSVDAAGQPNHASLLKKRVSFETSTSNAPTGRNGAENLTNGSANSTTPTTDEQGLPQSAERPNGNMATASNEGAASQPEMEQATGKELAVVPEDKSTSPEGRPNGITSQEDKIPGAYWMKPSRQELANMPREKLKKLSGFEVGRENCGKVCFDVPVDLTTVDLDNLFPKIVDITTRTATVYPDNGTKPPMGKGLNVPATITLQNSWPRAANKRDPLYERHGPRFNKHIERLKRVAGTKFVSYDRNKGEWTFKVDHFTTYGLDYDDETDMDELDQSMLSAPPDTPSPEHRTPRAREASSTSQANTSVQTGFTDDASEPDDTFEFKRKILPGSFDNEDAFHEEQELAEDDIGHSNLSFLGDPSLAPPVQGHIEGAAQPQSGNAFFEGRESVVDEDQEMAGAYPIQNLQGEPVDVGFPLARSDTKPKSILKVGYTVPPSKMQLHVARSWTEQLQRSVSPKKQDRRALRQSQVTVPPYDHSQQGRLKLPTSLSGESQGFTTSIDLMHSLFGQDPTPKTTAAKGQLSKDKGFKWPYPKRPKTYDQSSMHPEDRAFHQSFKPTWSAGGTILCPVSGDAASTLVHRMHIPFQDKDLYSVAITPSDKECFETLAKEKESCHISLVDGAPYASLRNDFSFKQFARSIGSKEPGAAQEKLVWELASVLFDDCSSELPDGIEEEDIPHITECIRKDRLTKLWKDLVAEKSQGQIRTAPSAEERAIAHLSAHQVVEACLELAAGGDQRLATLVATVGGNASMRDDIAYQLEQWRRLNALSEISEPIRALYELIAGNACISEGKKGAPEDSARTFAISDRLELDWKQAFGLRLWYSILEEEPLELAVSRYFTELQSGKEPRNPLPWYHTVDPSRTDNNDDEDLLWCLLKVYWGFVTHADVAPLENVLTSSNYSPNCIDTRLAFLLYHTLSARGIAGFSSGKAGVNRDDDITSEKADQLALDLSTELQGDGEWTWALFVLLHLSNAAQRKKTILDVLSRNIAAVGDQGSPMFMLLLNDLSIPEAWVWEAKALHARSVKGDHISETSYLLRAGNWDEAHRTLCRYVGPRAVVEEDYSTLKNLLADFKDPQRIEGWNLGGQVYLDYVTLVEGQFRQRMDPRATHARDTGHEAIQRLLKALPAMAQGMSEKEDLLQTVAVKEMAGVMARALMEDGKHVVDDKSVLRLPLTEDRHLKHTVDLSLDYYQAVLASAR